MASTEPPGPQVGPPETYTHTGHRFVLGYVPDAYAIWDRAAPGPPIRRYPRTQDGWAQAWREYSAWEPQNAPVGAFPAPYAGVPASNGKATAALVCGIVGLFFFPVAIAALVLGFMARGEIQRSGGRQGGSGMAMAGIVLGFISLVLGVMWTAYVLSNIDKVTNQFPNGL